MRAKEGEGMRKGRDKKEGKGRKGKGSEVPQNLFIPISTTAYCEQYDRLKIFF